MQALNGLNAILTGASYGIGPTIARAMASQGINLALAARSGSALERVATTTGGDTKVIVVPTDVNDEAARSNLVRRTQDELGAIDILVNNAGLEEIVPFEQQSPEAIPKIIQTNVIAPIMLAREVIPGMLERGRGSVVNVASLAGRAGMPFGAVYSGSKGALAEWSISLSAELEGRGVQVSAVCPGFVSEAGMHARKNSPAPGSLGEVSPAEVAEAVLKALRTGRPEILVSHRPIRILMALRALAPGLALGFARRSGMIGYLRSLAGADTGEKPA